MSISFAEAPESEQRSWRAAMQRECDRYGLDTKRVLETMEGGDPLADERRRRSWWELPVVGAALALFIWLALGAERQPIAVHAGWMAAIIIASLAFLIVCGMLLWKRTRFS